MRGRLTLLSLALCGLMSAEAPAQDARSMRGWRGVGGGGGRAIQGGVRGWRSAAEGRGVARGISGWSAASRAAPALPAAPRGSWTRPAARAGGVPSPSAVGRGSGVSSQWGRSLPAVPGRAASRSASGVAGWNRAQPGVRESAGAASSSGTLSPFARGLRDRAGQGARGAAQPSRSASDAWSRFARSPGADRRPATAGTDAGTGLRSRDATGLRRPDGATGPRRSAGGDPTALRGSTRGGATAAARPGTVDATAGAASQVAGTTYRRYGYTPRPYSYHGHHHHYGSYYCSPYYVRSRFYLSFAFGSGPYLGLSYYYPWYHYGSGVSFAFFYGTPVTYCYVPYGFYSAAPAYYVTRYVYVRDTYPTTEYEVVETDAPATAPVEGQETVEPTPAAESPVAEKYLRDASEAFRKADYVEAAKLFRLAALSAPDNPAPLFALGQALLSIGSDAYAAKVIRKAVLMNPGLVKEPGDIVGVFQSQEEFDRVLGELRRRAEESPAGSDARFLLAVERYFSGDPKAVEGFRELGAALPDDQAVTLFLEAAEKRFAAAEDLPPVEPAPAPK